MKTLIETLNLRNVEDLVPIESGWIQPDPAESGPDPAGSGMDLAESGQIWPDPGPTYTAETELPRI